MDEVLVRFPLLGQKVFKQLDEESLSKCRFVDKSWQNLMEYGKGHIENRSVLLKRKIKNFIRKQWVFKNVWTLSLQKVPICFPYGQIVFNNSLHNLKFESKLNIRHMKLPLPPKMNVKECHCIHFYFKNALQMGQKKNGNLPKPKPKTGVIRFINKMEIR